MNDFSSLGKGLLLFGLAIAALGLVMIALPKIPFLGKLPGDILVKRGNFTLYFPIVTSILVSVVLTVIFNLLSKK